MDATPFDAESGLAGRLMVQSKLAGSAAATFSVGSAPKIFKSGMPPCAVKIAPICATRAVLKTRLSCILIHTPHEITAELHLIVV